MFQAALLLPLVVCQPSDGSPQPPAARPPAAEQAPAAVPPCPDEEAVLGHPEGEAPQPPERVVWDLSKAPVETTRKRQRISLEGLWRFAAVPERTTPVERAKMGWINMAAPAATKDWKVYDPALKPTGSKWQGKPLEKFNWAWAEREITAPLDWVNHQIFLEVRGPWRDAELFVAYLPIEGVRRGDSRWYNLTEAVVYGGTATLSMRLKLPEGQTAADTEPYVGLELMPVLHRFDGIELKAGDKPGELQATVGLRRPKFFLGLPFRLQEVPLLVEFEFKDPASGEVVHEVGWSVGQMTQENRTITLPVDWPDGKQPPERAVLEARLTTFYGGDLDIPFPIEVPLAELLSGPQAR